MQDPSSIWLRLRERVASCHPCKVGHPRHGKAKQANQSIVTHDAALRVPLCGKFLKQEEIVDREFSYTSLGLGLGVP